MADRIAIEMRGDVVVCRPAHYLGNSFNSYLDATRAAGCRYEPATKSQTLDLARVSALVAALTTKGFVPVIAPAIMAHLQAAADAAKTTRADAKARVSEIEESAAAKGFRLFGFQKDGVEWLLQRKSSLLADEMGLGKTPQALMALRQNARVVVVGPVVAKGVWVREVRRWRSDLTPVIVGSYSKRLAKEQGIEVVGKDDFRWPAAGEMIIANYDSLVDATAEFLASCPEGVEIVVDEAHAIKSRKARRTLRVRALIDAVQGKGGRALLVTGSPLLNQPFELWSLLSAIHVEREAFGGWKRFIDLFRGEQDVWGAWSWGVPSPEAAASLKKVMLRRLQSEVMKDLPPVLVDDVTNVEIDRDTRDLCDSILADLTARGVSLESAMGLAHDGRKDEIAFTEMSRMRAALATAKIPALLDLVEQYEEQEEPVVVFSAHRAPVDLLASRPGWATITGDTPAAKRTEIENAFQAGTLKGVACTIRAGGVAITLTRSHTMVFVDLDWTPEINRQAIYRCKRIGQTSPVTVRRLIADHKMDERVLAILDSKTVLVDDAINAAARGEMTDEKSTAEIAWEAARGVKADASPEVKVETKSVLAVLAQVPAGGYALDSQPDAEGNVHTVFWLLDKPESGNWQGWAFLKVQAGGESRRFGVVRPNGETDARVLNVLSKIAQDVEQSSRRYGRELGVCGVCGRALTDEESRAAGIGPICQSRLAKVGA